MLREIAKWQNCDLTRRESERMGMITSLDEVKTKNADGFLPCVCGEKDVYYVDKIINDSQTSCVQCANVNCRWMTWAKTHGFAREAWNRRSDVFMSYPRSEGNPIGHTCGQCKCGKGEGKSGETRESVEKADFFRELSREWARKMVELIVGRASKDIWNNVSSMVVSATWKEDLKLVREIAKAAEQD